jgi:hypothetical protein
MMSNSSGDQEEYAPPGENTEEGIEQIVDENRQVAQFGQSSCDCCCESHTDEGISDPECEQSKVY